ncbi:MAG: shikimate dehydrogenase [Actinomycetota bacterium]|nr:shikimate dehydrogenase [Actinomycetota bacterium]
MGKFGFLVHPLSIEDVAKKYKIARKVSPKLVAGVLKRRRPFVISEATGIRSSTGAEAKGWFIAVPLLPHQMLELDEEFVIEKIVKACKIARKREARIVGLGAFTALVGNGGRRIADRIDIAVTTGNTYTIVTAIEGIKRAAAVMDINLSEACLTVVGATGSIGSACAQCLAPEVGELRLVGRNMERLEYLVGEVKRISKKDAIISTDISACVREADVIISVTGAVGDVILPEDIKPGAVICDVARPRDVSQRVAEARGDVLVIEGGIVNVPGDADLNFDFGLPKGMALACMAETMILALEGRYEDYTLGKDISVEKIGEMQELAKKHGFELAGLRSFDKAMTPAQIEEVKKKARSRTRGQNWI